MGLKDCVALHVHQNGLHALGTQIERQNQRIVHKCSSICESIAQS